MIAQIRERFPQMALLFGFLLTILALVYRYGFPFQPRWIFTTLIGLGVLLLLVGLFQIYQLRRRSISHRALRYGANTLFVTILFLGIVGMLAFLTTRHHIRKDLTEKGLYSLAPQTVQLLKQLTRDIQITAFYKTGEEELTRQWLENYAYYSSRIHYRFVDPLEQPALAKQYGDVDYATIVVESGANQVKIDGNELSENKLTNAILKVTRTQSKTIYFLTGHGEHDVESEETAPDGYSLLAQGLRDENFTVKTLNFVETRGIPSDCAALIIAGARSDLLPFERDSLKAYLDRGGKLGVFLDPGAKSNLVSLLEQYPLEVGNNLILDVSGIGQLYGMGPQVVLVSKYENHPMFQEFDLTTYFPEACSVVKKESQSDSIEVQELFKSLPTTWAETDYDREPLEYNEGKDIQGPVSMAVSVTVQIDSVKRARLLVIGDSDFATNQHIQNAGNRDLALNLINWLAEQEDMITIRPKEIEDRRVTITADQSALILLISVFVIPLVTVVAGVVVYFKRRK